MISVNMLLSLLLFIFFFYCSNYSNTQLTFFFQAEDGIRDRNVTGVQTCALPIYETPLPQLRRDPGLSGSGVSLPSHLQGTRTRAAVRRHQIAHLHFRDAGGLASVQIGRASCRERGKNREVESRG